MKLAHWLSICGLAIAAAASAQIPYTSQLLRAWSATAGPGGDASAYDVNNANVVVGTFVDSAGVPRGFVWQQDRLGSPARQFRAAGDNLQMFRAIAENNKVGGYRKIAANNERPIVVQDALASPIEAAANQSELGTSYGNGGEVWDLDGTNRYVGYVYDGTNNPRPCWWVSSAGGTAPKFIFNVTGANFQGKLHAVDRVANTAGAPRAAGYRIVSGNTRAMWVDCANSTAVPNWADLPRNGWVESQAWGINDSQDIVGRVSNDGITWYACFWNFNGGGYDNPAVLPDVFGGQSSSIAYDISDGSAIVGRASNVAVTWRFEFGSWRCYDLNGVALPGYSQGRSATIGFGINNLSPYLESIAGRGTGATDDAVLWRFSDTNTNRGQGTGVAIGSVSFQNNPSLKDIDVTPGDVFSARCRLFYTPQGSSQSTNGISELRSAGIVFSAGGWSASSGAFVIDGRAGADSVSSPGEFDSAPVNITVPSFALGQTVTIYGDTERTGFSPSAGTIRVRKANSSMSSIGFFPGSLLESSVTGGAHLGIEGNLTGKTVHFYLDHASGTTQLPDGVTNASGDAYFSFIPSVSYGTGQMTLRAVFDGDAQANPASGSTTVSLGKANVQLSNLGNVTGPAGSTVYIAARLLHSPSGSVPLGVPINYQWNGKTWRGFVNENGFANFFFRIPRSMGVGTHTMSASFAGDAVRNPASGTFQITVTGSSPVAGLYASGVDFQANGGYVSLPASTYLGFSSGYTVEFWMQPYWNSPQAQLFASGVAPVINNFKIRLQDQTLVGPKVTFFGPQAQEYWLDAPSAPAMNSWTHVAITQEGTLSKLYINGALVNTQVIPYQLAVVRTQNFIGDPQLNAMMNDVRIWSVARTASEISASKTVRLAGNEQGLLSIWRLNDGSGSAAASSNGTLNGTLAPGAEFAASTVPVATIRVPRTDPSQLTLGGFDPDGDPISFAIISPPSFGSLTPIGNGVYTYNPTNPTSATDSFTYRVTDNHGNPSNTFTVQLERIASTIPLQVALEGWLASTNGVPVQVVMVPVSGGGTITQNVTLNGSGVAQVTVPTSGSYAVYVQGSHYLRRALGTFNFATPPPALGATLLNGDVINDNVVDLQDYLALVGSFDLSTGQTGYNANADLDGSASIDIGDYLIMANNFDIIGD